jgi:hypothetical protein
MPKIPRMPRNRGWPQNCRAAAHFPRIPGDFFGDFFAAAFVGAFALDLAVAVFLRVFAAMINPRN